MTDDFLAKYRSIMGEPRPPAVPVPLPPKDEAAIARARDIVRQAAAALAQSQQLQAAQTKLQREPCKCGSGRPAMRCDHGAGEWHVEKVQEQIDSREPSKARRAECIGCHQMRLVIEEETVHKCLSCEHPAFRHGGRRCLICREEGKRSKCRIVQEVRPARIVPHKFPGGRVDDGRCSGSDVPLALSMDDVERENVRHPKRAYFWRCDCGELVRVHSRTLPQHDDRRTHKPCAKSGSELKEAYRLNDKHFLEAIELQDASLFRWLTGLEILRHCPDGRHARVYVGKELARMWADAGLLLTPQSVAWFQELTLKEALLFYLACTSAALRCLVAWLGGCNDEDHLERMGNEWGFTADGLIYNRGPRSWVGDAPKVRLEDAGGDRAGTFSGRHLRTQFALLRGEGEGIRKDRRRKEPMESWRKAKDGRHYGSTGTVYPNPYDKSVLYLTCETLQSVQDSAACRDLIACITRVCKPRKQGGGRHSWLWAATNDAREARDGTYWRQIRPASDRQDDAKQAARRKKYAQIAGRSGRSSYQRSNRYAVTSEEAGERAPGSHSEGAHNVRANLSTGPPQ